LDVEENIAVKVKKEKYLSNRGKQEQKQFEDTMPKFLAGMAMILLTR